MLRGIPPALLARLRDAARARGVALPAYAVTLLTAALDAHERRVAGGRARAAQPDAQAARLRGAAATRAKWDRTDP